MDLLTIIRNGLRETVEVRDCEMCEGTGEVTFPWEGLHNKGYCPHCNGDGIVEIEYPKCSITDTELAKKRAKRYYEKVNQ